MEYILLTLILGFILFIIIFAAVKHATKPILESINELKDTETQTDLGLLIDLRDNFVIEAPELSALINYRNDNRNNSINSNNFKRVEPLLKEMKELDIYDDETFENRLLAVKQYYGITDCTEKNIL